MDTTEPLKKSQYAGGLLDEDGHIDEEAVRKEHLEYLKTLPTTEQWAAEVAEIQAKRRKKV